MAIKNKLTTLMLYLFVSMLVLNVTGCGGGSSSDTAAVSVTDPVTDPVLTPIAEKYIEIEAITGGITVVQVGSSAQLTGSSSYSTSTEPLSYVWSITSKPDSSQVQLLNSTSESASFVADVAGSYSVQLVVSAEGVSSQRVISYVLATVDGLDIAPFHAGLSSNCSNCHIDDFNPIKAKSTNHPATSHLCQTCHTVRGFAIIDSVNHQEVFGNCSDCHNGVLAIGKSEFHVETTQQCDDCHNTDAFLDRLPDGSFDHSNITGGACKRCHNGEVATGKPLPPEPHPDTNTQCIFCHSVATFTTPFVDHTGPDVVGHSCESCHNDAIAIGKSSATPAHPETTADCAVCHTVQSFDLGGVFNHSVIDSQQQACSSCHNDINAIGVATVSNHPDLQGRDCANCHNTTTFTGAFVDHSGPDVVGKRCDSCHGVTAVGQHDNHLPVTTEDCAECHTPGNFNTGTFDHTSRDVSSCDSCHNDVISVGKLFAHLPTSEQCSVCHNTTDFADATFDHSGITNNCVSCHDGNISIGKSDNHVPTTEDCSVCHNDTSAGGFVNASFSHSGITDNCSTCHDGDIAIGKIIDHIPTLDDCSACHNDTNSGGFVNSSFYGTFHQGINTGCEGCHNGRFATGKDAAVVDHIPTTQDCYICHLKDTFAAPTIFTHSGITGNCVSCHDGTNVALGALGLSNDHIVTTQDCNACHNISGFTPAFVDHEGPDVVGKRCDTCHGVSATGKNDGHVNTTEDCATCHVPGTFSNAIFDHTGIVDNCASCHDGVAATGMSGNHIPVTQDCSVCHNPTAFAGAKYDHTGITNNCSTCHDGKITIGKDNNHVPTNEDCNQCHVTAAFIPATFDHAGIVDNCRSCHDGVFASGKTNDHVLTNQDCSVCHTTTSFKGAGFDHTGIVDNCESCHDGSTATGMNQGHVSTSLDCHFCHTTATFVGGTWTHDSSSAGNCDQCHVNGGGATFKPNGHLSTTEQCDVCHTTNGWAPTIFKHSSQGDYPGDHRRDPGCTGCHGNTISSNIPWPASQYAPFCAACHSRDFKSESKHIGGKSGTVEQNKNCGGSGCHRVSSSGF